MSSPGGYPGVFYRSYWDIVKGQDISLVKEVFRTKEVDSKLNKTMIVLIPKVKNAYTFNHFRRISLCNFIYKVVSRIISTRLRKFLNRINAPNRGAFVEGWWIAENTVIAQELVNTIRKHK